MNHDIENPSIEVAADILMDQRVRHLTESTQDTYRRSLDEIIQFLGRYRKVMDIGVSDVSALVAHFVRTPNSKCNMFVLRKFFGWMRDAGYIHRNPMAMIHVPRLPGPREKVPFTEDEYRRLVDAAGTRPIGWIVHLGWFTGMSMTDCCWLLWEHVDLDNCIISKPRQKTKTMATIPFSHGGTLHQGFLALRKRYPTHGPKDYVHPECNTDPRHSMMSMFRSLCIKAGIKGKTFHCFRVSLATNMMQAGVPMHTAMRITGHSSPAMLTHYAKANVESLRQSIHAVRGGVVPQSEVTL